MVDVKLKKIAENLPMVPLIREIAGLGKSLMKGKQYKRLVIKGPTPKRVPSKKRATGSNNGPVYAPVALARRVGFQAAPTRNVRNRELIATIDGSVAFSARTWKINPGLSATFPWLAPIASGYQQYTFNSLRFIYESTSATSARGQVIMAPEYSTREVFAESEQMIANTQGSVSNTCWTTIVCPLNKSAMFPTGARKYVRSGILGGELSLYDAGQLFLATVGMTDAATIGRLYAEYDIDLFLPQTSPPGLRTVSMQTGNLVADKVLDAGDARQKVTWNPLTTPLYATLDADAHMHLARGIYHIFGTLHVENGANAPGEVIIWLHYDTEGTGTFPPPYNSEQSVSSTVPAGVNRACMEVPFSWVARIDIDNQYLMMSIQRLGGSPVGNSCTVKASRSIMHIEAI